MSDHSPQAVQKQIRAAVVVFVVLLALTFLTVVASRYHLGHSGNIILALVIATVKASLVGAYFMHLIDERKLIFYVLIVCAIFFLGMILLPLFQHADPITMNI